MGDAELPGGEVLSSDYRAVFVDSVGHIPHLEPPQVFDRQLELVLAGMELAVPSV